MVAIAGWVVFSVALLLLLNEQRKGQRLRDRIYETRERAWEHERQQLLDRIMFMADRTWSPPPMPDVLDEDPESVVEEDALDVPIPMGDTLYYIDEGPQLSGRV
jgi:hypothetical protein